MGRRQYDCWCLGSPGHFRGRGVRAAIPKALRLASHTVALTSGKAGHHTAIAVHTVQKLALTNNTNPTVEQIANTYAEEHGALRREQALAPLGLSASTYMNANLSPSLTQTVTQRLANERLGSRAIIAGVDSI